MRNVSQAIERKREMKVIEKIATQVMAIQNCEKSGNSEWLHKHTEFLCKIEETLLPSGSGFDNGSCVEIDLCKENKIVLKTDYHHMNDNGMYDGWTTHLITIKPDFVCGLHITVSGKDRNDIKNFIHETFYQALTQEFHPFF